MHPIIKLVASYFVLIPVVTVAVLFYQLDRRQKIAFARVVILGGIFSLIIGKIASHVFYNPRPFMVSGVAPLISHSAGNGFPSDHTLLSAALAFAVYCYNKRWGQGLIGIAALIGLARMAAHVHHLIDIIGAFVFAGVGVYLAYLVNQRFEQSAPRARRRPAATQDK